MSSEVSVERLPLDLVEVPEEVERGPATLIVPSDDPLAEGLAAVERVIFPEAPMLFAGQDADAFHFMVVVVDSQACHIVRLSGPGPLAGRSGEVPFFVTDLVEAGQQVDLQELDTYYALKDIRMERMISVETNFRLGEQLDGMRSADLAYLSLFALASMTSADGVLAHLNAPAISSLERVGVAWHPLAGREDLVTPTVAPDGTVGIDPDYRPVCIPRNDPQNQRVFTDLAPFTPRVHFLRPETVVDLRAQAGADEIVDLRVEEAERSEG